MVAAAVGVTAALPAGAAPIGADVAAKVAVSAAEQAAKAVAKGLDKGPGAKAPQGAPYPAQKAALAAAANLRQAGPTLGTESTAPKEVAAARTRTTRTELDPISGNLRTELSGESLNYQDSKGTWQPIDTTLKPAKNAADGAAGGWTNGDNRFDAAFPASLADGPVVVADAADAARSVSLRLLPPAGRPSETAAGARAGAMTAASTAEAASAAAAGTSGALAGAAGGASTPAATGAAARAVTVSVVPDEPGSAKDDQVTYADAAGPGLNVAYAAGADAVKEAITLDSAAAAAALAASGGTVSFALAVGKGLTPKLSDTTPDAPGGEQITVVDAKGATAFVIPAAFMDDAQGAHSDSVSYTLSGDAKAGWTLTLTPDAAWLGAADRAYPVVVDPTIEYPSPRLACALSSAAPTTANCGGSTLPLSWNSSNVHQRATLRFDELLNVVPADAQVWTAKLKLHVQGGTSTTPNANRSIDVKELTSPFTNAATWNTRNGSTAWTTPGGDTSSDVWSRLQVGGGAYHDFDVSALVNRWVEGQSPYYGFALSKTSAVSGGGQLNLSAPNSGNSPSLYLEWNPRVGNRKGNSTVVSLDVTDRTKVSVNPATGNAAISVSELHVDGSGTDLSIERTSNSLSTAALGPYGYGWSSSLGGLRGVNLQVTDALYGHVRYTDASGASWMFFKGIDGTYARPDGLDADLIRSVGSDTWTLTDRSSQSSLTFANISTASGAQGVYGLTATQDRSGNRISYTYDTSATTPYNGTRILRSVTDTRGRTANITNPGYFATALNDSANRTVFYTVTNNILAGYRAADGGDTTYSYDSANRVTRITTAEGRIIDLRYDSIGRITKLVNGDGGKDNSGNATGPTWQLSYSAYSRTASGAPSTTTSVIDPNGQTTTFNSDGRGRIAKIVDARSKTTQATYTTNDDVLTQTRATPATGGGVIATVNAYNAGTWTLSSSKSPSGDSDTYAYGSGTTLYNPASFTDARGFKTTYTYDGSGNQVTATTDGVTTTNLYQGSTDPQYGGVVNCGPVANGAVTATKPGLLCESRDGAYAAGTSSVATTAHRTLYRYDALGHKLSMTPPSPSAQSPTTYTYDDLSRLEQVRDGNGQTTIYGYDELDRQTYVMYPDGSSESYYITADGTLRSQAEYDNAGTATRYAEYQLDGLHRLVRLTSAEGDTTMAYDAMGKMTTYDDGAGEIKYFFNGTGELIAMAEPGGDCAGQTFSSPGAASARCILFQVNDDGERTAVRYPGGQVMTYTLDDSGRTTRILGSASSNNGGASTVKMDLSYSYSDPALASTAANPNRDTGLIMASTDNVAARKTAYSYDGLERLTVANTTPTSGGSTISYEAFCYDGAGNRTKYYTATGATCSTSNPAVTYTYDAANALTQTAAGSGAPSFIGPNYSYDANGNELSAQSLPGRSTVYNPRNQAIAFTPAGGSSVSASYASSGNEDRLTLGLDMFRSSLLASAPARKTNGSAGIYTLRDPDGKIVALRLGSASSASQMTSLYPFTDQVNSVRVLVDAGGQQRASYSYSAFGVETTATESLPGGLSNPFRYAEGVFDQVTRLTKMGARYYDANLGRFTQPDPSGLEANCYIYAGNNPISFNDPRGLFVTVPNGYIYAPWASYFNSYQKTLHDFCSYSPNGFGYGFESADSKGPCARHDICYEKNIYGTTKCNEWFLYDLRENCAAGFRRSQVGLNKCYGRADTMFRAVRWKNP